MNARSACGPTAVGGRLMQWSIDGELFALMRSDLYTAVVGDFLDTMGREHQFLPAAIRPLREEMKVARRAMPVLMMAVYGPQSEPFGLMTKALDDLRPDEVYVGGGSTRRCANWGEIMTAAARCFGGASRSSAWERGPRIPGHG